MESVKRIRNERGLSQRELAKRAGLNTVTLVRLEKGVGSPQVDTLEKLAEALGVPIVAFFDEEPADPKAQAPLQQPDLDAAAVGQEEETERRLARLERHVEGIRVIAKGLDPEGSVIDRMTAEFIKAKLREIEGVLPNHDNALANHLGDILEGSGEEVEVYGMEETTAETTRPESKQS